MRLGMQRLLSQLARYREGHERNGNRSHASPPVQKEKKAEKKRDYWTAVTVKVLTTWPPSLDGSPPLVYCHVRDGLEQM